MANKILHKRSNISGDSPDLNALDSGELAINTSDGYIFFKKSSESGNYLCKFIDLEGQTHILNVPLSGFIPQFGNNTISEVFASILCGYNNIVDGAASSIVNGEDNKVQSDFSSTVNGINNKIDIGADYSFIAGGQNNKISHSNVFTLGSNLSSHADNFTYVNNLSVLGKIYGDGSELTGVAGGGGSGDENVNTLVRSNSATWDIIGDRYFTTSISTNSINKGTKVFAVSANLSYIPTQDITIVRDHDASRHMHGTVLDYNSSTGSLTADINSHTGSGSYSNWKINLGGVPTFVDYLVGTNNLSDVSSPSTALANLSGVSRTELRSLSGSWQSTFTTYNSNSASYATSSFVQSNFLPLSGGTSTTSLSVQDLSASKFNVGTSNTGTAALFVGTDSKVGINTETPNKTLTVSGDVGITGPMTVNDDIEVTDYTKGIILRSPNDSRWRITVTNSGALSATAL